MIKNNRINALVDETKGIDTLLDIGCDHGLVIKRALEKKNIKKAIASDISENALSQAKANLTNSNVKFVVSDGFNKIKEQYDGVVIAGMGAETIIKILNKAPLSEKTYILQPNGKYDILRKYLENNNFKIIDEVLIFDKFYYVLIKVVRGDMNLNEKDIYLGPILRTKKSSISYYENLLKINENLLSKVQGDNKETILKQISWLKDIIR